MVTLDIFRNKLNRLITRVILLLLPNEQTVILVLKNTIRRDDPLSSKIILSEGDRKWRLSTCWQAEDARLFLTDSHDSLLSFSRSIRHRRWPEPKSVPPIRMHLSANTRNQFARYFLQWSVRPGFPSTRRLWEAQPDYWEKIHWY